MNDEELNEIGYNATRTVIILSHLEQAANLLGMRGKYYYEEQVNELKGRVMRELVLDDMMEVNE